jgi:hypothetical protein
MKGQDTGHGLYLGWSQGFVNLSDHFLAAALSKTGDGCAFSISSSARTECA